MTLQNENNFKNDLIIRRKVSKLLWNENMIHINRISHERF
jgi:hypothetical protein